MIIRSIEKLAENLERLIAVNGSSITLIAKKLNVSQPTIFRISKGQTQKPKPRIIKKLAAYFKIPEEELIGNKEIEWANIDGWINTIIGNTRSVPLYSWTLNNNYILQKSKEKEEIVISCPVSSEAFALKVKDSSMEPVFPLGSTIICDPNKRFQHGSFVIVMLEHNKNLFLRKLLQDIDINYIKPLNKEFGADLIRELGKKDQIFATVVHVQYDF